MRLYRLLACLSAVVFLSLISGVADADWLRFRGPNGSGISEQSTPTPTKWSPAGKREVEGEVARAWRFQSDRGG